MESDARFYRRRATEELAAASRAVTPAARDRRMQLAQQFLSRLEGCAGAMLFEWDGADKPTIDRNGWSDRNSVPLCDRDVTPH